jgi:competence protein ComEC
MTLIMLGAVLFDRQAFSMRNLALAAGIIVLVEPEALLGASFQLSFAAVAGLIAVWEIRLAARSRAYELRTKLQLARINRNDRLLLALDQMRHGPLAMLLSTICATAATTSFMAYDFHELSPYVLIGNPLTLSIIEVFAVPAALLGSFLFPLGLDAWVWIYLGWGIDFIMWLARWIATLPGATIHLKSFAPWSLCFLSLAVLSAVLWRSPVLKLSAIPLLLTGLFGAWFGDPFDIAISPQGDAVAIRAADGYLNVMGQRPSIFMVEQWLRADGDGRAGTRAVVATPTRVSQSEDHRCDKLGCVGRLPDGRSLALVFDAQAAAQDCLRADLVIAAVQVPIGCPAPFIIDRNRLRELGAVTLRAEGETFLVRSQRQSSEDRPWSRAPKQQFTRQKNGAPVGRAIMREDDLGEDFEPPPFQ